MAAVAAAELQPPAVLVGKQGGEVSEEHDWIRTASPAAVEEALPTDPRVACEDRARHALFSLRLRRDYLLYCFVCFVLAGVACTSALENLMRLRRQGQGVLVYQRRTWEAAVELAVGVAVAAETLATLWLSGRRLFLQDCWCVFDAVVVALTLLEWLLQLLRWAFLAKGLLNMDLPLLALRFVMQPCRMLTAVSMVRRVRKMQQGAVDVVFDVLKSADDPEPAQSPQQILSRALQAEVSSHLPAWCRFREWHLAYSLGVHGTSMRTFFRGQASCAANVILLRTDDDLVLGGFVPEGWRTCPPGSYFYGTCDAFVFTSCDVSVGDRGTAEGDGEQFRCQPPVFFHARGGSSEVLLWGDASSLSLGGAISVRDDFRLGSTSACEAFGSPALVKGRTDFAIAGFECWQLA